MKCLLLSLRKIAYVTFLIVMCFGCSDQHKVEKLVNKYAKKNIADYKSFEIVTIDSIKDAYSDLVKENRIATLFDSYCRYYDSLTKLDTELNQINNYLNDAQRNLNQKQRKHRTGVNGFFSTGQSLFALVLDPKYNYLDDLVDDIGVLKKNIGEAESYKAAINGMKNACLDSLWSICYQVDDYCKIHKSPQYLGKETIVKYRFKDENGVMKIASFDVIVDKRVSSIISIKETMEKERYDRIHDFVEAMIQNAQSRDAETEEDMISGSYVVIDVSDLRLRLGSSTSSDTFKWNDGSNRHPNKGEKYRYLGESGDFYKIDYKGHELWVS